MDREILHPVSLDSPLLKKKPGLLPGSGVLAHLFTQNCNKGAEEGFAAAPGVVHELEEAEIQRQLRL